MTEIHFEPQDTATISYTFDITFTANTQATTQGFSHKCLRWLCAFIIYIYIYIYICTNTPEYTRSNYKIFYGFNLFFAIT